MKKLIIVLLIAGLLAGCSASNNTASNNSASENNNLNSTSSQNLRIQDNYLEYQDNDGNWQKLISIDALKGENGKNGVDGKNGINGKTGQTGLTGNAGATGATGQAGKDGIDGSQNISINNDGELIIDGVGTGYLLTKKELQLSIPVSSSTSEEIYKWMEEHRLYISYESTNEYKAITEGNDHIDIYYDGMLVSGKTITASALDPLVLTVVYYDKQPLPTATPTPTPTSTAASTPTPKPSATACLYYYNSICYATAAEAAAAKAAAEAVAAQRACEAIGGVWNDSVCSTPMPTEDSEG